jgi:FkbM family methyltransferase
MITKLLLLLKLLRRNPENFFLFISQFLFRKTLMLKINSQKFYQNRDKSTIYHITNSFGKIEKMIGMIPADIDGAIIDGGANNGLFSFLASDRFNSRIYAFEPSPDLTRVLEKNIENRNIQFIRKAISGKTGSLNFYVSAHSDQIGSMIKNNVEPFEKNSREIREFQVESTTLTDFIKQENIDKISVLKLDLQGSEFDALRNAEPVLMKTEYLFVELMFMESSVFELIDLVRKYFPYHQVINPVLYGADILFSKKQILNPDKN